MGLIPPQFFDCVVALGQIQADEQFIGIASGFLCGRFVKKISEETSEYVVYLVTNRHVFEGLSELFVRFNPTRADQPAKSYRLNLLDQEKKPLWVAHLNKQIDVAATRVPFNKLLEESMQVRYFRDDVDVADVAKMNDLGMTEGDFAYVLGFPMQLVGARRNVVIARSATIARIRDALSKENPSYLIDSFVFPGNSGGPVISKPEALSIVGTKSQNASYLIGIVKSYVTYRDVAVSLQTKQTRVVFEENSGLAEVHPIDFVQETIDLAESVLQKI